MGTWLEGLRRWIRRLFTAKKKRRNSPQIIRSWYGKHCAVLRIERNTPGGLSTYRITSIHATCDYLITLDYLPDLLGAVVGKFQGTVIKLGSLDYPSFPATHRFAVCRVWPNSSINPIGVWDVDLEGFTSNSSLRELAPRRAVAGVALLTLSIVHSKENPFFNWQLQMENINWLFFLKKRIRGELSNPSHNLKAIVIFSES